MAGRSMLVSMLVALALSAIPGALSRKCMVGVAGKYSGCGGATDSDMMVSTTCADGEDVCILVTVAHKGIEIANQTCSDVVFYEGMCGNSTSAPCDDVESMTLKWNEHLVATMGAANFSVEGNPEAPTCTTCNTDDCNTAPAAPTDGGSTTDHAASFVSRASLAAVVAGVVTKVVLIDAL